MNPGWDKMDKKNKGWAYDLNWAYIKCSLKPRTSDQRFKCFHFGNALLTKTVLNLSFSSSCSFVSSEEILWVGSWNFYFLRPLIMLVSESFIRYDVILSKY